ISDMKVTQVTILFEQYSTVNALSYNGIYWIKFIKNNCNTWKNIPNKFSANDILEADCKEGEIYLNDIRTPQLGALGNDWEEFYLTPGLNQIGIGYSNWVTDEYAPEFKVRYREAFL
ncbi:MAG: phage distal tail protein, partial [Anaerovoracaceae bacterium]